MCCSPRPPGTTSSSSALMAQRAPGPSCSVPHRVRPCTGRPAPCSSPAARPGVGFPQRILLADDGSPSAREAARIAAALAARHAARVEIISPPMTDGDRSRALAEDATAIIEATSVEPVLVGETGHAHHAIVGGATAGHVAHRDRQPRPARASGPGQRLRTRRPPSPVLGPRRQVGGRLIPTATNMPGDVSGVCGWAPGVCCDQAAIRPSNGGRATRSRSRWTTPRARALAG